VALSAVGVLAWHQGQDSAAERYLGLALAIRRKLPDESHIATTEYELAKVLYARGHGIAASELAKQSLERSRDLPDHWGAAVVLNLLGERRRERGDLSAASGLYEESRQLFERGIYHRTLDGLRLALGDQEFATAWEEGQARSLVDSLADTIGIAAPGCSGVP
jgi:tetratricopeptide (TPR) repeat protein